MTLTTLTPPKNLTNKAPLNFEHPNPNAGINDGIGFFRIWEIVGDKKRGVQPILPIGRTTFLNRVKANTYPAPVRISARTVAWRKSDIFALIAQLERQQ